MAHNPILKQQSISRTDLGFKIEHNTVGLLYQGHQYTRLLQPGEGPTMNERLARGELIVYVIDLVPHVLTWRVHLPTKDDKDFFSATVNLRYRVGRDEHDENSFKRIVGERVTDTEILLTRTLEPLLRQISRSLPLNQHIKADAALTESIQQADLLASCSLKLVDPADVVIDLTEDDRRRIENLDKIERAMRVVSMTRCTAALPTKEPAYRFQTTASINYRVQNASELPSDSLEEAMQQLWPAIERALRRESQNYTVDQVSQAEAAMQSAVDRLLDDGKMQGSGLQIVSMQVSAELDEIARQHRFELEKVKHAADLQAAEIAGLERNIGFYDKLIEKGEMGLLAISVQKGEISYEALANRMNQQQRERLDARMKLLEKLRSDNIRDEEHEWEIYKTLIDNVAGDVVDHKRPALPPPQAVPQLPDSQGNKDEPK